MAIPGTQAAWTDSVAGNATIATGSVDLKVQDSDAVTGYTSLDVTKMESGDSKAGLLTVRNAGTAPLYYYIDATVSSGFGSSLTAKVTIDTTTNGAICTGSAVAGSGSAFGPSLLGSAAAPVGPLMGGATRTLCIQATLPNGGVADGSSTTIGFTFRGSTGTAGSGWADAVPVSGTSISAANAFYLGTRATGNTTYPTGAPLFPLRRTGPTLTTLYNYDTDRDTRDGLLLRAANPPVQAQRQQWFYPVGSSDLTLSGTASLRIWSAVAAFNPTASGSLSVTLSDCDASGGSCNNLLTATPPVAGAWSGGSNTWVSKTLPIITTPTTYTWLAGRSIGVTITNAGSTDMMLAYDTTSYRSALLIN